MSRGVPLNELAKFVLIACVKQSVEAKEGLLRDLETLVPTRPLKASKRARCQVRSNTRAKWPGLAGELAKSQRNRNDGTSTRHQRNIVTRSRLHGDF